MSAGREAPRWRWTREGRMTPPRQLGRKFELTLAEAVDLLGPEADRLMGMNVGDDFQDMDGDHWERIA